MNNKEQKVETSTEPAIDGNGLRLCAGGALKHEIFNSPLNLIKKQKI